MKESELDVYKAMPICHATLSQLLSWQVALAVEGTAQANLTIRCGMRRERVLSSG